MASAIDKGQLCAAITVAVLWRLWHDALELARSIGLGLTQEAEVPPEIVLQRRAFCPTCRIYFRPLRTCDSPFRRNRWPVDGVPEGCLCHTPTKARVRCNCPLYDRSDGIEGWPTQLNSFPKAA